MSYFRLALLRRFRGLARDSGHVTVSGCFKGTRLGDSYPPPSACLFHELFHPEGMGVGWGERVDMPAKYGGNRPPN